MSELISGELISGKEAMCKAIEGEIVLFKNRSQDEWYSFSSETWEVSDLAGDYYEFCLKPRTITLNGIEVPAPFEPKAGEQAFYITAFGNYDSLVFDWQLNDFGYWRTEEEIKQVVVALREVFK